MELERVNKESLWTVFDIIDYERVKNFPYTWHSYYAKKTKSYYCVATRYYKDENGKSQHKPVYLAVFILNPDEKPNIYVDHIHHDTLDNRRCNLRISSNDNNSKNRNGKNSNNTTGYRNVIYTEGLYVVQISINGKNTRLKSFKDVDEAGAYAELMRQKYYGTYAGKN